MPPPMRGEGPRPCEGSRLAARNQWHSEPEAVPFRRRVEAITPMPTIRPVIACCRSGALRGRPWGRFARNSVSGGAFFVLRLPRRCCWAFLPPAQPER